MTAVRTRDKEPVAVRASAVLAGSGAYDSSPLAFRVARAAALVLYVTYTRGGASGGAKLKLQLSDDNATWYDALVPNSSVTSGAVTLAQGVYALPVAAGAAAETYATPPFDVRGAAWARVAFAEVGNTGSPGTLAATGLLLDVRA